MTRRRSFLDGVLAGPALRAQQRLAYQLWLERMRKHQALLRFIKNGGRIRYDTEPPK